MSKKFYAVKKGRGTGVFSSWEEVKKLVIGFSGADQKAFKNEEEAWAYLCEPILEMPTLLEYSQNVKDYEMRECEVLGNRLAKLLNEAMKKGKHCVLLIKCYRDDAESFVARSILILSKYGYSEENLVIVDTPGTAYSSEVFLKVK